jgi:uncharacterized protein with FMN-binding domain
MKELIYTGIFAALGILFIVLLIIMFLPEKNDSRNMRTGTQNTEEPRANGQNAEGTTQGAPSETNPGAAVSTSATYIPGVYTTELVLNDQTVDVEVIVDRNHISSIRLVNLNEAVATMYPLLQPTFDSLREQIYEKQSLDQITYQTESKYTSLVLLEAISNSLEKAAGATER